MSHAANIPRKRVPILALILLAAALAVPAMPVQAHEEDVSAIEAFLHGLVEDGAITEVQHRHIVGIADRGRTNYGHTMFVNDGRGLLFLNSANSGSTLGCQVFDLSANPFARHRRLERQRPRLP